MTPQFGASLTDDSRVVIYDHNMFIIQAIVGRNWQLIYPNYFILIMCRLKQIEQEERVCECMYDRGTQ